VLEDSRRLPTGSVGLGYLDPPYATERVFEAGLRRRRGEHDEEIVNAFDDHWADYLGQVSLPTPVEAVVRTATIAGSERLGGYVRFMAERLVPLARVLSPTGSLYVHVSPFVGPYLRVVLDLILGAKSFRNEIVWRRTHAHSSGRRYGPVHDTILFYARPGYEWHKPTTEPDAAYIEKHYRNFDASGRRYQLVTCNAPGDRTGTAAHYRWKGLLPPPGRHWAWQRKEMERLERQGRLEYSRSGIPRRTYYADEHVGTALQDVWADIRRLDAHSVERVGFDTQKPLALLRRVISASAPRNGELAFDGFAGTGTTLLAAEEAGVPWVGSDISLKSLSLALGRLSGAGLPSRSIRWIGGPTNEAEARSLARQDADAFGLWATSLIGLRHDQELSDIGAIYARNGREIPDRAVAAPTVRASHLQRLVKSVSGRRFAVSVNGQVEHPQVRRIRLDRLLASAASGRVPVGASSLAP
jgi:site-specific DNA-methyltransferase (adenine-specific)